ncbi:type IV toxin-antitoxin system AbiEi family antitoxin domain-containing protein [Georgenia muralis]
MNADVDAIDRLARRQDAVLSRRQLIDLGATPDWMSRRVTSGRWLRLHPGVYLVHTGAAPWRSRARAALLYAGNGAALSHTSAAFHHQLLPEPGRTVHVSVPSTRRVRHQPGLRIHHRDDPPPSWGRLRATSPISTVLDLVAETTSRPDNVVALVCAAAQRNVDLAALRRAARARGRLRHRALIEELVPLVDTGIESPLEFRYHALAGRHGLPQAVLQVREILDGLWLRADCRYVGLGLRVELDGRLAHPHGRTDTDVWRDNAVVVATREITLRYRWRHVALAPCAVARQVALALVSLGWAGRPRPCSPTCAIDGQQSLVPKSPSGRA